ncbi:MAG: DNA topoisomerase IV, partial [Propionibacteriaceae bacterium]|nr:DNA topoisomerase IV [Propionibacteriaceae bacterium]
MEHILLSAMGRVARVDLAEPYAAARAAQAALPRAPHDVVASGASAGGPVAVVTSAGRALLIPTATLPLLPAGPWSLADAPLVAEVVALEPGEGAVSLWSPDPDAPPLALGTAQGVVKRVAPEYRGWDVWEVMAVKEGDRVVGAGAAADGDDLAFVTTDGQLLRTAAREVRAQGRAAGGMAGVKLAEGAGVLAFAAVAKADRDAALVATLASG